MSNFIDMRLEVEELNNLLRKKYNRFFSMDKNSFKRDVLSKIGKLEKLQKLDKEQLKNVGVMVGVDGSVNKLGGAYPHYVELYQALAKPTVGEDLYVNHYYTPILSTDMNSDESKEISKRAKLLAQIELECAIESVKKHKPRVLMMDGGLIRYKIDDKDRYLELIEMCEEEDVILVGVIKDLKTNVISRATNDDESIFDRELLYGKLDLEDLIIIDDEFNKKYEEYEGLVSAFLKTSSSAMAIGIDLLESQRYYVREIANLVYSLTPYNSRGVPIWLDIVDSEVKITNGGMKALLEEYLDRDIYERFFISERDRRSL